MDVDEVLKQLYAELDACDQSIAALESLAAAADGTPKRGRPPNRLKASETKRRRKAPALATQAKK